MTKPANRTKAPVMPEMPLDLAGFWRWDAHPGGTNEWRLQSADFTTKWYYKTERAIEEARRYLLSQPKATPAFLPIDQIRTDGGTQARAGLDEATVAEYAATYQELSYQQNGLDRMPPIVVYYDGTDHWLADGFHRLAAYRRFLEGKPSASPRALRAEIKQGTRRDAVLYACGANASHGLRRTNADKRRAVETLLRDEEWGKWSDSEIARRCQVDHKTVASVRADLYPGNSQDSRTVQRGSSTYQMTPAARPPEKPKIPEVAPIRAPLSPHDDLVVVTDSALIATAAPLNCAGSYGETGRAQPFEYYGRRWICTGTISQGNTWLSAECHEVVPLTDYTGTPQRWVKHAVMRPGAIVSWRGEQLVMTDRRLKIRPSPAAPAPPDPEPDDSVSDRTAYTAKETADRELLDTAELEIASGNVNYARQLLERVQVLTWRRDQLLERIAAPAPSVPGDLRERAGALGLILEEREGGVLLYWPGEKPELYSTQPLATADQWLKEEAPRLLIERADAAGWQLRPHDVAGQELYACVHASGALSTAGYADMLLAYGEALRMTAAKIPALDHTLTQRLITLGGAYNAQSPAIEGDGQLSYEVMAPKGYHDPQWFRATAAQVAALVAQWEARKANETEQVDERPDRRRVPSEQQALDQARHLVGLLSAGNTVGALHLCGVLAQTLAGQGFLVLPPLPRDGIPMLIQQAREAYRLLNDDGLASAAALIKLVAHKAMEREEVAA